MSGVINTGGTDSMTYHTGRPEGTDGKTAVQYRNMENLWGNVCERRDGIIFFDDNICTYNNPADFKDAYTDAGAATRSNKWANAYGYISAWGYDSNDASFICPSTAGGSETTYVPDQCERGGGVRALVVGGFCYSGDMAGLFNFSGIFGPGGTYEKLGSRLQKLPRTT